MRGVMMRTVLVTIGAVLCMAGSAFAQVTSPITSYEFMIFATGVDPVTGNPMQTHPLALTDLSCNQAPLPGPGPTTNNPRFLAFDDPANAGRQCVVDRQVVFLALPLALNYRGVVRALSVAGPSARSAASNPFSVVPIPPPAPTGVFILQ